MEQAHQIVPGRHPLHGLHSQLVLIRRNIAGGINRRQFMLAGCNFFVLRFGGDAQLPQLIVQLLHKRLNAGINRTEIMIVQLLTLRRFRAEQSAPGKAQIFSFFIQILVYQEIFLFTADAGQYAGHICMAKQF